jgi:hypothetical protein
VACTASKDSAPAASRSSAPTSRLAISALKAPLKVSGTGITPALGLGSGWLVCHPRTWARSPSWLCSPLSRNLVVAGGHRLDAARGRMGDSDCPSPDVTAPLRPAERADSCRRRPTPIATPPDPYRSGRRSSPCAGPRGAPPRGGVAMIVPFLHSPKRAGHGGRSTPVPCQYDPTPKRVRGQVPCRPPLETTSPQLHHGGLARLSPAFPRLCDRFARRLRSRTVALGCPAGVSPLQRSSCRSS